MSWLDLHHVYHEKIFIDILPGYGRCVITKEAIKEGEIIMSLPNHLIFSPDDVDNFPLLSQILNDSMTPYLSVTNLFALMLLSEVNNPDSLWADYWTALPNEIDSTLFWSPAERAELQVSTLIDFSNNRARMINISYESIFTKFLFEKHSNLFPPDVYTLNDWNWALSIVWSRGFSLTESSGGFVPLADFFNSPAPNDERFHFVRIERSDTHFTYIANVDIDKGVQILTPYGVEKKFSNAQLLMDYGFVFDDNPNDIVLMKFELDELDPLYNKKVKLLDDIGITDNLIPVRIGEYPRELIMSMRVKYLNKEEMKKKN